MSSEAKNILTEAKDFALKILENELPESIQYHSADHTKSVVEAALEIGENSNLSADEMEIVQLAAWFHDLGYKSGGSEHEVLSTEMAENFLNERDYDASKVEKIKGCILATRMPQSPKNRLEWVLCDADLIHLAKEDYFEKSRLLLNEMNEAMGKGFSSEEWMQMNCDFITNHQFFTDYARQKYGPIKRENLASVKKKIKKTDKQSSEVKKLEEKIEKLKLKVQQAKETTPTRGIETMFRLTSKNHLDLSGMADNKANIMISVNSIILSVIFSLLIRKLEEYPHLTVPAFIITAVCLATIIFSILATRPNVTKGVFTPEDIHNRKTNLLFFGNFHKMKREDYEWGMKEMMKDADYLYTSLTRDIYFLGVVLGKKYRLLRVAYNIFMFGLILSVIAFIIAERFFKVPATY
ncbi:MAG: HD domain-containing protein [Cyclobacteriaceae bacterium]